MARGNDRRGSDSNFDEKVVQVNRVSKKTKGGNKMGFAVLMVVGDRQGKVGVGLGKAPDVLSAIRKGARKAKKRMLMVPMDGSTIPFPIEVKSGASRIMLKPAPSGSGVIAGGPVRAVVEAAGIRDISSKILGTDNKASNVYTTFIALQKIRQIVDVKGIQLKSIAQEEEEERQKERELQREAQQKAAADKAAADESAQTAKKADKKADKKSSDKKVVKPAAKDSAKSAKKPATEKKETSAKPAKKADKKADKPAEKPAEKAKPVKAKETK
jgi:small subunit ribosomal protein S5